MKLNTTAILFGSTFAIATFASLNPAHGSVITTEITPSQLSTTPLGATLNWTDANGNSVTPSLTWTRPTSASNAAATLTTYAEWDGFAVVGATNKPTGNSYMGTSLTAAPTAGDSSSASGSGSFIIANGTANNAYYTSTSTGDIYSFSGVITPQITAPTYNVAGNELNVLVQVEQDGQDIDTSALTVNGVLASTLANYAFTQSYTDGGAPFGGFGTAYRNDYAWEFTLPDDPASLQLNFGWGVTSAALTSAVIDTESVPASVPEPASLGLLGGSVLMLLGRRRRRA